MILEGGGPGSGWGGKVVGCCRHGAEDGAEAEVG